ncbi:hypothetical protein [Deinococcus sp.]|uniref:hypothetical protein n=1 Tax=Deinococcus sp. TaxID=47478 RepID=UPI003CC55426
MSEDKGMMGNLADAAKNKVDEVADRAREAGHNAAAHIGNNPLENAADKAMATEDHVKAEVHHAEANAHVDEAKQEG